MTHIIAKLYAVMDKRPLRVKGAFLRDGDPLRALSFVMAIVLAGCMFWDPSRFAARTSTLEIWHGLLLMWAVCAGIIHGVGFRPESVHWQGIFCPLLADIVLIVGLIFFFL
ncbi:Protein YbgE [Salmonella enterica subsp. enterica serovar Alachua str. R6-377]|uniref:Protein YbgE n=9 Tax=Salmonella TaxID=590 RepID=G5LL15_SALET|nr:Protein YbgE [Salmonella enterica subsp. enterica serovar Alachua str. R6-377]